MAVQRVPLTMLVFGVMVFASASLCADEPSPSRDAVPSASATPSIDESPIKLTPEQLEKKKKAYIGLVALAGIVIVGVSLGALIILWGGRLRRQLRKSDPECPAMDRSFWFLKPPKPSITRSSLPELNRPLSDPPSPPPSEPQ